MACMLVAARAAPVADPEAFLDLGAIAIPAITGSALLDGLLLGKVAFLKGQSSICYVIWTYVLSSTIDKSKNFRQNLAD